MKFKPLVDEEEERRRASAAAKLRALDEAIAKRKAEEERYANPLSVLLRVCTRYCPTPPAHRGRQGRNAVTCSSGHLSLAVSTCAC